MHDGLDLSTMKLGGETSQLVTMSRKRRFYHARTGSSRLDSID
jgi:hypothetical protein